MYEVVAEDVAEQRYQQAGLRNTLSQAIAKGLMAERGTGVGQYDATKMELFDAEVTKANTLLAKASITQDEVTAQVESLNSALLAALSMPEASTSIPNWYQITSLRSLTFMLRLREKLLA